jgi:hypothetical protein
MATNDTTDDTVLVTPNTNTNVYHTDPDCISVAKADKTRELPKEQVEQWFYDECGNCNRDITSEAKDGDRSIYIAACKS